MSSVKKKSDRDSVEMLLRRLNRKVLQSGLINTAKSKMYFEKPLSKSEARKQAIMKNKFRDKRNLEMMGLSSKNNIK